MTRSVFHLLGIMLSCALLAGCGGGLGATVSGMITYDGEPLHTGDVAFHPTGAGAPASGSIGADGSYELRTASKTGLTPGDYQVTVASFEIIPGDPPMPGKPLIPPSYNRLETSGLQYSIARGQNTIDIKLEKRPQ